ncbi:GMC family oxidoreductase [Mesorhizobium sp. M1169]|uniref:GMC family oxidoreductase n=1 Tax=Mesorhizobium sp. M1169 TaxID=2957066 RepID=UPI003338E73B
MIFDLKVSGEKLERQADVLIVGAGTAGLILAVTLAEAGLRVVCLESGAEEQRGETHPLNAVHQLGEPYAGAEYGRFRCLGGSSTRWGGALIPFQPVDLNPSIWPVQWDDLSPFLTNIERLFGFSNNSYEDGTTPMGEDHVARLAKWPRFSRRNVYTLLHRRARAAKMLEIIINATATRFGIDRGRLAEVEAQALNGGKVVVRPLHTVIAAGAIESTRILLLIDRVSNGMITSMSSSLGCYFQDHLSAKVATLKVSNRPKLNKLVGFRFERGGVMRNLRFELSPQSQLRTVVPACFAHIAFSGDSSGFEALRDLLRSMQRRELPSSMVFVHLLRGLPWFLRAVWWRLVHQRLLYPDESRLDMHMVIDQGAHRSNQIALSDQFKDVFGQPLASIHWSVGEREVAAMQRATDAIEDSWRRSEIAHLAKLDLRASEDVAIDMKSGGGIYHPTGSTRMAYNPSDGVVDRELRVFALQDVSVCSTSVLPTGGGANPTMMLLLLTLRCAQRIKAELMPGR